MRDTLLVFGNMFPGSLGPALWLRANCANLFMDEDSVFLRLVLPSASWDSICMYACTQDADMGYGRCRTPESQLQLGARSFPTMIPVIRAQGCRCRAMTRQIGADSRDGRCRRRCKSGTVSATVQWKESSLGIGAHQLGLRPALQTAAQQARPPSTVPCSICIIRCFTLARLSRASLALLSDASRSALAHPANY